MKKWEPSTAVALKIATSPVKIRGYQPEDLLLEATFKIAGPIASLLGMTGITFRPDHIVLSQQLCASTDMAWQARVIFHELVHTAQEKDMGMLAFKTTYGWQWVKAGGSYERMKTFGIEQEAYKLEAEFVRRMW